MDSKKLVSAFASVVAALAPLDPESRRRVLEATHAMLPVGAGEKQGQDRKGGRTSARRRRR
jgi:hypothetical protein